VTTTAIILAGGRSRRMGRDKASLAWGDATLLARVILAVPPSCVAVIVSCAAGQALPALPVRVRRVEDLAPDQGPLAALEHALGAVTTPQALVCACDQPLLGADVLTLLLDHLIAPATAAVLHPPGDDPPPPLPLALAAGPAREACAALRAAGRAALRDLVAALRTQHVPLDAARQDLLAPCNTPEEYARLRSAEHG
jgi:molybdopterin-guanine dinucleotide biosynthesis protein A